MVGVNVWDSIGRSVNLPAWVLPAANRYYVLIALLNTVNGGYLGLRLRRTT